MELPAQDLNKNSFDKNDFFLITLIGNGNDIDDLVNILLKQLFIF